MSRQRQLLGCRDMAFGVETRKLQGEMKLGRDIVFCVATWVKHLGVATPFWVSRPSLTVWYRNIILMSRQAMAFWGRDPLFGVATSPGLGREESCRDMIIDVVTWLGLGAVS